MTKLDHEKLSLRIADNAARERKRECSVSDPIPINDLNNDVFVISKIHPDLDPLVKREIDSICRRIDKFKHLERELLYIKKLKLNAKELKRRTELILDQKNLIVELANNHWSKISERIDVQSDIGRRHISDYLSNASEFAPFSERNIYRVFWNSSVQSKCWR